MGLRTVNTRLAAADIRRLKPAPKTAKPFYLTRAWRRLVMRLIRERGRRCEQCERKGCRVFGDHKVELADGGAALDPNNVELLCGSCHSRKTADVRANRRRGAV